MSTASAGGCPWHAAQRGNHVCSPHIGTSLFLSSRILLAVRRRRNNVIILPAVSFPYCYPNRGGAPRTNVGSLHPTLYHQLRDLEARPGRECRNNSCPNEPACLEHFSQPLPFRSATGRPTACCQQAAGAAVSTVQVALRSRSVQCAFTGVQDLFLVVSPRITSELCSVSIKICSSAVKQMFSLVVKTLARPGVMSDSHDRTRGAWTRIRREDVSSSPLGSENSAVFESLRYTSTFVSR